jgi:hypothetical protein
MPKFRKKPVVIEAEQYDGSDESGERLREKHPAIIPYRGYLNIPTLEGVHRADPGDWIICGIKGEVYPCKPDIFEATYEPA